MQLAGRFHLEVSNFDRIGEALADADIVIVATGANKPVVRLEHFDGVDASGKILLDLSVPRNIDPAVSDLPGVRLANMDDFESEAAEAFEQRKTSIPEAEAIIDEELDVFRAWMDDLKVVPTIKALTEKLEAIRSEEFGRFKNQLPAETHGKVEQINRRITNKIAAHLIEHLRENNGTDDMAEAIQSMFRLEVQ